MVQWFIPNSTFHGDEKYNIFKLALPREIHFLDYKTVGAPKKFKILPCPVLRP
jgi:hypothetical protein